MVARTVARLVGCDKSRFRAEARKEYKAVETTDDTGHLKGNRLLGALPAQEFERLRPHLETVTLEVKDFLYERDEPIEYVHFPIDCVTSVMATMKMGRWSRSAPSARREWTVYPCSWERRRPR